MLAAAASDHGLDATRPKLAAVLVVVIAAVCQHSIGSPLRVATPAAHRPDRVDQRQQLSDIVAMPAGQADRQRNPGRIGQEMVL